MKPTIKESIKRKALKEKILTQIKKILKDNKTLLSSKIEKAVKRSIKQTIKYTHKKKNLVYVAK